MRRVAITGIGLVTPLGIGTEETWRGLLEGRSAVGPIRAYDPSSLHTQIAAELDGFDPEQFASRRSLRSMTRNDELAVAGAALAVQDAGLELDENTDGAERGALFLGSNKEVSKLPPVLEGALVARNDDGTTDIRRLGEQASSAFNPLFYVEGLQAASLFYVSQPYGLKGSNTYFAGTAEAGAHAIGCGFRAVRRGEADVALVGGFDDPNSWWQMCKFDTIGILTAENELGARACRPYDASRSGTVLGEGASILVLEELERATARGGRIYAEIVGYGSGSDAHGLMTPDPEAGGLTHALRAALEEAGTTPENIDYVASHGSGTRAGDATEALAFRSVLDGDRIVASSVKPATGHLLGGAGALNASVAALAVRHGQVPPTLNLEHVDRRCEGVDWVPGEARRLEVRQALAVARGLEGQNVVLAMRAVA